MILYPMFYRKYGVRRLSQLTTPALHGIDKLELPRDTIFHYKGIDATEVGISPDDPVLRHAEKIVMVDHVVELVEKKGPPRTTNQLPAKFIRDYHRRYRRLRPLRKMDSVLRDPRTVVVVNYAIIPHLVRYTTSFFSNYYAWYNIQATMWSRVAELARETDRHQFIRFSLPKHLPSLVDLKKAEQTIARNTLDAFNNDISLDILDIWTWLGENRENSPMSKLGDVDLNKINLVWVESGRWFTINLGLLSDWRIGGEDDVSNESVAISMESQGTDSYNLQRRFLRALMTLFEAKTVVAADIAPEDVEEEEETEDTTDVEVEVDPLSQTSRDRVIADLGDEEEIPDFDLPKVENVPIISPALTDDEIEADLRELERRVEVMDEVPPYVPESATLEDVIIRRCDELVDQGMMSAAEYRRLNKLASRYKEAINPYGGNQTIEDFIKVSPEDLKVSSEVKLPINSPVLRFDPSFAKSSLKDLDRDYINKILPKNIVANVMAIQRAGIAVADYQIDEVEDVMNHYEVHTVRLVPAVGAPSTVRFRVPKVAENGIFRANGVKYRLRRQRADKPIRKTGPNRVALTSYHSKLFVERSEKRVNNYAKWLCSFITEAGLDTQNSEITEMKPSTISLGEVELPFIYTTLASHYRSFTANGIEFYFDYHKRQAKFGEDVVKGLEKKGFVVVGKQAGNKAKFVLVDKSDTFYYADGDQLDVIGKIHDILTIDPNTSPLEMAEVKIFNKNIPLGIVLGAKLGLSGLLKILRAEPRRAAKGERLNLQPNEYAIRFSDETLIFDKEDRQTMLIVSGFAQYRNAIKRYGTHDFDRQEVYYNILEVNGIGGHYVREINLLYDTFIDPITSDLLKEMKEPTDMVNLFLRSAELLLTDHHPPETMMPYMRLRGYERLAGAVYGELIRSVRGYNSKPRSSAAKVEMKPQAVWNSILQDPALSLVDETNPIQNLKEVECVTFTGVGGRSMRSMVERSRIYDKSDMGVISESTTDSSTVGVISYTPPDPKVNSLYGTTDSYDKRKDGAARLLSTSALLSPAADMDDPKRVN